MDVSTIGPVKNPRRQHVPEVGQADLQTQGEGWEPEVSCTGPSGPLVFQEVELEMEEVLRKEQLCYCVSTTIPVEKIASQRT